VIAAAGCGAHAKPAPTPAVEPVCGRLVAMAGDVGRSLSGPGGGDPDRTRRELTDLVATGPREIRPDLRVVAREYAKVAPAIRAVNADPTKIARLRRAIRRIDGTALGQANARVTDWIDAHC
jgi:hypothetical protein